MNKKWLLTLLFVAPLAQAQLFGGSSTPALEANWCDNAPALTSAASGILKQLCASGSAMAANIAAQTESSKSAFQSVTKMALGNQSQAAAPAPAPLPAANPVPQVVTPPPASPAATPPTANRAAGMFANS